MRTDLRIFIDTNILSDIAKKDDITNKVYSDLLLNNAAFFFILPSILELGFGKDDQVHPDEVLFLQSLIDVGRVESYEASAINPAVDYPSGHGRVTGVMPDVNSYAAGKNALIQYMTERGKKPKNVIKDQIDAILTITAWNTGSFIWTNDIDDIIKLSYFSSRANWYGVEDVNERKEIIASETPPVFTTEMLNDIIDGKVFNVYERMMDYVGDAELLDILRIAANA